MNQLLDYKDVAKHFKLSERTIRRWKADGLIKAMQRGARGKDGQRRIVGKEVAAPRAGLGVVEMRQLPHRARNRHR